MEGFFIWPTLTLMFTLFLIALSLVRRSSLKREGSTMPTPARLPIIGHLYLFQGNPILQLSKLSRKYGEIYRLHLGSVETVVVNSIPLIREVLIQRGSDFGNRPSFIRYSVLFGNDKNNSLAFCDWSSLQKTRRSLARRYCHSGLFADRLEKALETTCNLFICKILQDAESHGVTGLPFTPTNFKLMLQKACANIFFDFFCSKVPGYDWSQDIDFEAIVKQFDAIFWEINQSHPTDVLPFLAPMFKQHLASLGKMGKTIRKYVIKRVLFPHAVSLDQFNPDNFLDILLDHTNDSEPQSGLTADQILFELEDFLGGHSAVSNLLCRAIVEIAACSGMSEKIYKIHFEEKKKDYIQAVIYETLRRTSSPIVPHVASCDSSIGGYPVKKGTMILINNYDLNTSPQYWHNPADFIPERFLLESGRFKKPPHFFPFSYGKRACMGYQLVEKVTERLILALIEKFDIHQLTHPTQLPIASVALHPDAELHVYLTPRNNT